MRRDGRALVLSVAFVVTAVVMGLVAWHLTTTLPEGGAGGTPAERAAETAERGASAPVDLNGRSDAIVSDREPDAGVDTPAFVTRRMVEGDVTHAATEALGLYHEAGNCLLMEAGYLDLCGNVWGCVVRGDGWVDLCTVHATESSVQSLVTTARLDAEKWGEDLGTREIRRPTEHSQ